MQRLDIYLSRRLQSWLRDFGLTTGAQLPLALLSLPDPSLALAQS